MDANTAPETVLFSDNFNTDSSANWTLYATDPSDYTAQFAYDYSSQSIPPAPHSSGDTHGLFLTVNKDATGAAAAVNLYRIIEEGLTNVRQHSGATEANVVLTDTMDHLLAVITDNGRGIDLDESVPLGMGMLGMRERALFLGADLKVTSYPGAGTELTVAIPRRALA